MKKAGICKKKWSLQRTEKETFLRFRGVLIELGRVDITRDTGEVTALHDQASLIYSEDIFKAVINHRSSQMFCFG